MHPEAFLIQGIIEGSNSVLFQTPNGSALYERLVNTIHTSSEETLGALRDKIEPVGYSPLFESDTLKREIGKKMSGLVLNVTETCNLACSYCIYSGGYVNERTETRANMDFETAKKAIDLYVPEAEDPTLVSFYGGEPLNRMGLIKKVIDYARDKYTDREFRFSMTTNFYNATNHFQDIVERGIYLLVSLDGPKEVHDKFRITKSGRPTWDRVMDNLRALEKLSPGYVKSHVGQSVTCADPNDILEIIDFFREEDSYSLFRIGGVETKGLLESLAIPSQSHAPALALEFLEHISQERPIPNALRLLFEQDLRTVVQRDRKRMPDRIKLLGSCYPGRRKLFVDTDGHLYMCEKFGTRLPIGHVNRGLDQTAIDESIDRFKEIRDNLCGGCWAQRLCTPCIQSAKDPEGEISEEGLAKTCDFSKQKILTSLALYIEISRRNKKFLEDTFK